jgi:hydroxyacylglutathione hydrolase
LLKPTLLLLAAVALGCAGGVVGQAPLIGGRTADIVAVPLRLSNVHVIRARVPILVDTGTIGDMDDLEAALTECGVATSAIGLIIVTHGHADHAGLAADLQHSSGATVILGAGDVPLATAGHNDELKPTSFAASVLKPFIRSVYPELTADITVAPGESFDLAKWGLDGKIIAMPGHTPGSLVVVLADHTAFVGDMIAALVFPHRPGEHLYQADPVQNRKNIQTLLDLGVTKFYLGHGGPVARADVIRAFSLHGTLPVTP